MAHNDKIIGARHLGNLSEILNILSLPIDMQTGLFFFPKICQKNNRKIPQPLFITKQYKDSCFHKFSWQLNKGRPLG